MEERVLFLINKFQSGQMLEAEKTELLLFIEDHPDAISEEIFNLLMAHDLVHTNDDEINISHHKWDSILQKIVSVDQLKYQQKPPISLYYKWAAAAVLILALTSIFIYKIREKSPVFTTDIAPGGNKAILTLANGKKISLSDVANGDVIKEAGLSISKTADGHLVYHVMNEDQSTGGNETNTITTPNGGEWQIHLPDGSDIWLNAASSLEYPLNMSKTSIRSVRLKGEAYFEVAKDSAHPFVVETEKQKLEVLGTHFNINSYADERTTRTTLLEGSVRISSRTNLAEYGILKPGEQSVLSAQGIKINTVDTDESVAWKKGYFMFNNEKQESILRKISRWYNIKVEYADEEAKDVMYYGTVSRFDKISQVLHKFEQTGEVRFEMQGNKIIVYKD